MEWKSRWLIGSVFSAPLLLRAEEAEELSPPAKRQRSDDDDDEEGGPKGKIHQEVGPLKFVPNCKTLIELYSSPDLAPRLPPRYPGLSLVRFLHTSGTTLLPSTASSVASEFGPQLWQTEDGDENTSSSLQDFNCLQLLPCGELSNSLLAFFPTGENCDQVGYVMLRFEDSRLNIKINEVNNKLYIAKEKLNNRISKLSVNPIVDVDDNLSGNAPSYFAVIGYLMASSMYSVHWYVVKTIRDRDKFEIKSALLDFLGSKLFRSSAVVHSCWNPHLSEESIILLETGDLYLFDLSSCLKKPLGSNNRVGKKKLQVSWDDVSCHDNSSSGYWLSCEFSWHPRILVVAHTTAVFLVDARADNCNVSFLLKIQVLSTIQNDRFLVLSRAGSDGFHFCVASAKVLLLCDVRQPSRVLLQWVHNLDNPRCLTVFGLSELWSSSNNQKYKWASESGYCILLGSFWNCEFSLFFYGPDNIRRSVSYEISKFCNSFYAWGLPSELSLSGRDCHCGSCLLRDDFLKDSLSRWVDWRQKKDVVLGFGLFPFDCLAQLPKSDNSGGFLLVRLMSSGKLEAQRYCSVWELHSISSEAHFKSINCDDNLFYDTYGFDYDLKKKFQILKLNYIEGYLKGNLAETLFEKLQKFQEAVSVKEVKNVSPPELGTDGSGLILARYFDAYEGVNFPISIHEIALRVTWSRLQLAFSSQFFPRVAEFLSISHHMGQFPFQKPSFYNKKINKIQPSNDCFGSFLPPQFLITLLKLANEKLRTNIDIFWSDSEINLQCDRILEVVDKLHCCHGSSDDIDGTDDLTNSGDNLKHLSIHKPEVLLEEVLQEDMGPAESGIEDKRFTNFLFRKQQQQVCNVDIEMPGLELLDKGCPLELKFNNSSIPFGQEELKHLKLLKEQDLKFQKDFILYQEFALKLNLVNQGN